MTISKVIIETLQNLISPAGKSRLSRYVESTQFQVLFGEHPDPKLFYEEARQILHKHEGRINELAHYFTEFMQGGKNFKADIYSPDFLPAYLAYYFTTNVCKVQLILLELVKQGRLAGTYQVIDVGVGSGTTTIAVLDFMVAWATVCDLYGVEFPITELYLTGLDANSDCLNFAKNVVETYATMLPQTTAILEKIRRWAEQAQWHNHDLKQQPMNISQETTILVASNALNELGSRENWGHFNEAINVLAPNSLAIIIEPGDETKTSQLNAWRKHLLANTPQVLPIAPCGSEFGQNQPHQCNKCWNARRESLHQPELYKRFRLAAHNIVPDKRKLDEYQNNLLSYSYSCLLKVTEIPLVSELPPNTQRYVGSVGNRMKLCPGYDEQAAAVYLEREAGFEIPLFQHGDLISLEHVSSTFSNGKLGQERIFKIVDEHSCVKFAHEELEPQSNFLQSYSETAINELAYRFFGFPNMREFQHTILQRVLSGLHTLGIAATGGGKSECFILPAMLLSGITIVVSPLKSLMQDQYQERISKRYGLVDLATYINGDVSFKDRQSRLKRMELGHYKLIYFTPEQLERGYVLSSLKRAHERVGIRYLAIDEAHCISQWGHDFRPSYLNLLRRLRQDWKINPTIIALTATASFEVRQDICEELELNFKPIAEGGDVYVYSSNRHELNLIVQVQNTTEEKAESMVNELKNLIQENENNTAPGAAIVFMSHTGGDNNKLSFYYPHDKANKPLNPVEAQKSQEGLWSAGVTSFASYLERQLQEQVAIYHGGMENQKNGTAPFNKADYIGFGDLRGRNREEEQTAFIENEHDIMIATKGFGMGIDKPNIRLVMHRTPPGNLEAYMQEAGRAGRDGGLADVLLFYSPDKPTGGDSDFEIQKFFLDNRYIRQIDVKAMRDFLRTVTRKITNHQQKTYLYFTNDEVMQFFDEYPGYIWPEFNLKKFAGFVLKGQCYKHKQDYIGRILSVLYSIRPDLEGQKRLALVEEVQETGLELKDPDIKNIKGILHSNSYFGELFRSKNITEKELRQSILRCINANGMLQFAEFLGLSPNEMADLFWDIKNSDTKAQLLDFKIIATPKFGPAEGKDTLQEWRNYAGALKAAFENEANRRAKKAKRAKPNNDDWYYWPELNKPKGWEVCLGEAFHFEDKFAQYLDVFMTIHEQRKANDWAAYRRLLTDYVGVDEKGQLLDKENRNCLRAVMLGYLKTYEVIEGDNCHSCSRCHPDNHFSQDMTYRKSLVIQLLPDTIQLLEQLETYHQELALPELIDQFWQRIQLEQNTGRNLRAYIEGWTGRLLLDTQKGIHKTAIWLRVLGMVRGLMSLRPTELVDNLRQLVPTTSPNELSYIQVTVQTWHELIPHNLEIDTQHQFYVTLHELFAPACLLADNNLYATYSLLAARTAQRPSLAMSYYQKLLSNWDWARLQDELAWLETNQQKQTTDFLVKGWLELNQDFKQILAAIQVYSEQLPHLGLLSTTLSHVHEQALEVVNQLSLGLDQANQRGDKLRSEINEIELSKTNKVNQLVDELGQVNQKYTKLQSELTTAQDNLLISENKAKELNQAKQDVTRLRREVDIANDSLLTNKNRIVRLNQELSEANQQVQRLKKDIDSVQASKQKEIIQLQAQLQTLQGKLDITQSNESQQVSDLNDQIQYLLTQLDTVVASNNEQVTQLHAQMETLRHDLETSQVSKQELATTLQTQIKTLQHDLETSQVSKQELATTLQIQIKTLQHDLETSQVSKQEFATTLQTQIQTLQYDLNAIVISKNEQSANFNTKIQSLQSQLNITQTSQTEEINKLTLKLSKSEKQIESLQSGIKTAQTTRLSEISELYQKLDEAAQNNQSLQNELNDANSTLESQNKKLITKLKRKERDIQTLEEQLKPDWIAYIGIVLLFILALLSGPFMLWLN